MSTPRAGTVATMKRLVAALIVVAGVALALVLTAGDGDPSRSGAEAGPSVPVLNVARLDGSGEFALASLSAAETPTLLWFWAPWCSICNSEAPAIEELARSARGELSVVAIGGRDDAENGPAFADRHGLRTPLMLFDEPMRVWAAYRIPAQPGAVLLDRQGRERGRWLGAFDLELALEAARAL